MENHGTEFTSRHKRARENIEAMKEIWTRSKAEYHGELVNFDPMMAWPKPVQRPHPPIYVGGAFPYSARRAIRYGDGWLPQAARRGSYRQIAEMIPEFHRMAEEAGRAKGSIAITVWHSRKDVDLMRRYEDLGVDRAVFSLEPEMASSIMPKIDEIAEFVHKVNG